MVGVLRGGLVVKMATKMVRSRKYIQYHLFAVELSFPYNDGKGGRQRRETVVVMAQKRRAKRPCDRIASFFPTSTFLL